MEPPQLLLEDLRVWSNQASRAAFLGAVTSWSCRELVLNFPRRQLSGELNGSPAFDISLSQAWHARLIGADRSQPRLLRTSGPELWAKGRFRLPPATTYLERDVFGQVTNMFLARCFCVSVRGCRMSTETLEGQNRNQKVDMYLVPIEHKTWFLKLRTLLIRSAHHHVRDLCCIYLFTIPRRRPEN